jgi:hypothetical protein
MRAVVAEARLLRAFSGDISLRAVETRSNVFNLLE